jgi:flagella basal body P-ring formation protein FlgA
MMKSDKIRNSVISFASVAFMVFMAALVSPTCQAAEADEVSPVVVVNDAAWVKGEKVYLKDVAEIDGPSHLVEALGDIYLAYAPSPGREKKLHGEWIKSKIQSKPWVPAETLIQIAEFIQVGRRCRHVEDDTFLELYRGHVAKRLNDRKADFQVRRFKVIGNRPFPEGELEIKLANLGRGDYMGNVNLSAAVYIDGSLERRVSLSGWVDRFEEVVCCRQGLSRHSVVSEADVCLRRKNISKLSSHIIKVPERAVGKRVKHSVDAGSVLTGDSLEDVPVVERGDRVTIVVESDALRITAMGIAEDRGAVGDQIRVKNCMGEREIVAAIVDSSTVKIEF